MTTLVHAHQYPTAAPTPLVVEGGEVFWIAREARTILRVGVNGGKPSALVTAEGFPEVLCALAGHVYWSDSASIREVEVNSGRVETLSSFSAGVATAITADPTGVYWATWDNNTTNPTGAVMRAPLSGGAAVTLVTGQPNPTAVAVNGLNVYWTNYGQGSQGEGAVMMMPKSGGSPTVLATVKPHATGVAVLGQAIYWSDGEGTIFSKALVDSAAAVIASGQSSPRFVVDESGVYWTNYDNGTIVAVGKGGGPAFTLAAGQGHPSGIGLDRMRVYWVNSFDGEVLAVTKPSELARP